MFTIRVQRADIVLIMHCKACVYTIHMARARDHSRYSLALCIFFSMNSIILGSEKSFIFEIIMGNALRSRAYLSSSHSIGHENCT